MGSAKVALPTVQRRVARRDDASGRRRRFVIGKCRGSQRRHLHPAIGSVRRPTIIGELPTRHTGQFTRTSTCRLLAAIYGQALLARETTRNRYV